MNTRTTGLLIAFAFALITIGVVLFVYIRHASAPVAEPVAPVVAAEEQIQAIQTDGPIQGGSAARIQGTAKDDPTRQVYDFTAERIDPKPNGIYDIESPKGWIYLDRGRALYIRAERGEVVAPAPPEGETVGRPAIPSDPEKGRLEGNVVIRLFANVGPGTTIDPETAEPLGTFRTDLLRFNALTVEASSPEEVSIWTPDMVYRGRHMTAQFDQVRSRFFVTIESDHFLKYTVRDPEEESRAQSPGQQATAASASSEPEANPPQPVEAEPKVDLYHCSLTGDLMMQQVGQGRWVKADRLDLWARLVDGKLPQGALAPLDFGEPKNDQPASAQAGVQPALAAGETAESPAAAGREPEATSAPAASASNVVTLTWTGPLVLSPLDDIPAELSEDDAAMRFSAAGGNRVLLTDDGDASVECAMLEYAATTRRVTLSHSASGKDGTTMDAVLMKSVGHGAIRGPVIHADLTTGVASVEGAGSAIPSEADGAPSSRQLSWAERADLVFRMAEGRLTGSIKEALLTGSVNATDGQAALTADMLQAIFERSQPDAKGTRADLLSRLIADGQVRADAGTDDDRQEAGWIEAAHLDVAFDTGAASAGQSADPTPRMIDAHGAEGQPVVTQRGGERMECGRLLAGAERDAEGRLIVTTVTAADGVHVSRDGGIEALANRMEADGRTEVAEFFENVELSWKDPAAAGGEEGDSAVIRGDQARIGGQDRVIEVFGPGQLTFVTAPRDGEAEPGKLTVTWTTEMRFNDVTGVIDCVGNVVATNHVSELETEVLSSHRVLVHLEDAAAAGGNAGDGPLALNGRRVREVEAIGESMETAGGEMATAELRRYVPDASTPGGKKLEQFARLQGDRILASEVAGTLLVPGPGNAALYDARAVAEAAQGNAADESGAPAPGQIRGATLFRWDGQLRGDNAAGTLVMKRGVEMVHKPLDPTRPELLLVCEQLQTRIEPATGAGEAASAADERKISQVEAEGAVYARADRPGSPKRQELIADRLFYDAATGILLASASDGNRVTLFDSLRGAPIVAKVLEWNLATDTITVEEMSAVSSPLPK